MTTRILVVFLLFFHASSNEAQDLSPSISITPHTNDETLFQGSEFRRVCSIDGVVGADVVTRFMWERDGALLDQVDGEDQLQLRYLEVDQIHEGEYACRVSFIPRSGEGDTVSLPPVSAGMLTVIDRSLIIAPSTQVLIAGASGSLTCSYSGGLAIWRRQDGSVISGSFSQTDFADEGVYICDIFHHEPGPPTSINIPVMLYVVVPVEIVDRSSPVYQNLTRNQPVTFSANFRGRQSHDLTVTWFYDDTPLASDDSRISNSFNPSLAGGRTEFALAEARRTDSGLYHVVIRSQVGSEGEVPVFTSQEQATFQLDVTVRPAVPVNLNVDQFSATTARVTWLLGHQMPDERADNLILTVTFANHSLAERVSFSGDLTSMVVENLIPATDYNLVLTAANSDGRVTTNPLSFSTLRGQPLISSVEVVRVNQTWFTVAVHLSYTGGGDIASIAVSYRSGTGGVITLEGVVPDRMEGLTVRVTVILTADQLEQAAMELDFTIAVQNTFGYRSDPMMGRVPVYSTPSSTTTMPATTASTADSSISTELLPPWLIAVIASVVTMLAMIVLVACIVATCVCFRTSTKSSDKFKVNVAASVSTLSATESGMLPTKSLDGVQVDHYRARSQSSSVPSEGYTPSLDERFMDRKHRRELSESSSIGVSKLPITPSTTASNSPSNLSKGHLICSHDKGLHMITETEAVHSDDSGTESERDRIRQKELLHEQKMLSPSRQNIINSQYVRSPADGCGCGSSHQSLVSGGGGNHNMQQVMYSGHPGVQLNYSEPKHLHTCAIISGRRPENMYSDCDSVASSVSHGNISLPCNLQPKHLRPVQHRPSTPYNHDFQNNTLIEEQTTV